VLKKLVCSLNQPVLKLLIAFHQGILVIAAAGNFGKELSSIRNANNKKFLPAGMNNVLSVGALTSDGTKWQNSNFLSNASIITPFVWAPGHIGMYYYSS